MRKLQPRCTHLPAVVLRGAPFGLLGRAVGLKCSPWHVHESQGRRATFHLNGRPKHASHEP